MVKAFDLELLPDTDAICILKPGIVFTRSLNSM